MKTSKRKYQRLVAITLILAIVASLLTGCKTEPTGSSADNRETTVTGETKEGVNPDVSQPEQSIASDALVSDPTTESTTEPTTSSGNSYTLYGKTFNLSVHLEDYYYEMEGSDYTYFNLEEFMGHYGLVDKSGEKFMCDHNAYGDGTILVEFDTLNSSQHNDASGNVVCTYCRLRYPYSSDSISAIEGGAAGIDTTGGVFEVNGCISAKGNPLSAWCLTYSEIVVLAVLLDCYQQTGDTASVKAQLGEIFDIGFGSTNYVIL